MTHKINKFAKNFHHVWNNLVDFVCHELLRITFLFRDFLMLYGILGSIQYLNGSINDCDIAF